MRDTIAAIATPRGAGGIGIVRISGPDALRVLEAVFRPASGAASFRPWVLHHGVVHDGGGPLDDLRLLVVTTDVWRTAAAGRARRVLGPDVRVLTRATEQNR